MKSLSILLKPVSGSCNMQCGYCFYRDVSGKREEKNRGRMSLDTLECIVKKALEECTGSCSFAFQGGEPTLAGIDFFRQFVLMQKEYNRNGLLIFNSIQTNGININEEWAEFFQKNHFLTGLSVDGTADFHNGLRRDVRGEETFDRCMKAAGLFERYGTEYNILTVVTENLAADPDRLYHFYQENGFRYVQLIPCIDDFDRNKQPYSLSAERYSAFLKRMFDLWYDDFIHNRFMSIRAFDNYIQMLLGYPAESCDMNGICSVSPVIEADGRVYPCDFYVTDNWYMGDIRSQSYQEILKSAVSKQFADISRQADPSCIRCEYHFICRGGCRREREPYTDKRLLLNKYCKAYKDFFQYSIDRMKKTALYFLKNQ